jgi:hypothetical protein
VAPAELPAVQAVHRVVSSQLLAGIPVVRVYSEGQPGEGFIPAEPDLEDAYFHHLSQATRAEAA